MFWVKLNKGVCKQMAATRSEAVTAAWSPCGRYVATSTVAPRLRVDNNVRVFTYYGAAAASRRRPRVDAFLRVAMVRGCPGKSNLRAQTLQPLARAPHAAFTNRYARREGRREEVRRAAGGAVAAGAAGDV